MSSLPMSFQMFHLFRTLARRWKRRLRTKNLRAADWILTASRVRSLENLLSVKLQPFWYHFELREKHRGRMRKDGWNILNKSESKGVQSCWFTLLLIAVNQFLAKLITRWNFWQRSRWPRQMRWMVVAALINRTEQVRMKVQWTKRCEDVKNPCTVELM